jgi:hypothetical protein
VVCTRHGGNGIGKLKVADYSVKMALSCELKLDLSWKWKINNLDAAVIGN